MIRISKKIIIATLLLVFVSCMVGCGAATGPYELNLKFNDGVDVVEPGDTVTVHVIGPQATDGQGYAMVQGELHLSDYTNVSMIERAVKQPGFSGIDYIDTDFTNMSSSSQDFTWGGTPFHDCGVVLQTNYNGPIFAYDSSKDSCEYFSFVIKINEGVLDSDITFTLGSDNPLSCSIYSDDMTAIDFQLNASTSQLHIRSSSTQKYEVNASQTSLGSVSLAEETIRAVSGTPAGSIAQPNAGYHLVNWNWTNSSASPFTSTDVHITPVKEQPGLTSYYTNTTYTANFAANVTNVHFWNSSEDLGIKENTYLSATNSTPSVGPWAGHTFNGWNVSVGGNWVPFDSTGYNDSGVWKYAGIDKSEINVYANWTACSSVLTFDVDGGQPEISGSHKIYCGATSVSDLTAAEIAGSTKAGFTLNGWNISGTDTTIFGKDGNLVTTDVPGYVTNGVWSNTTDGATIALKAWWGSKITIVTLDNRTAESGAIPQVTAAYGQEMPSISSHLPTKTGYTFHGYYTSLDRGTTLNMQYYNADGTSAHIWDIDEDTYTLYANWTENTYTIYFDANHGSGSMSPKTVNYTELYALPPSTFTAPAGQGFTGWLNGTSVYSADKHLKAGAEVSKLNAANGGSWTFYANWTDGFTVTYAGNGNTSGTVPVDSTLYIPGVSDTVTVKDCGSLLKAGYHFGGWNNSQFSGALNQSGDKFAVTESVTLTAYWIANTTTATFKNGDATVVTQPFVYNASIGTISPAVKTGYVFNGWNLTTADGISILDANGNFTNVAFGTDKNWTNASYADGSSITLCANFTANQTMVSFDISSGIGGNVTDVIATYDAQVPAIPGFEAPGKRGYVFAGFENATSGVLYYDGNGNPTANVWKEDVSAATLTAKWTVDSTVYAINGTVTLVGTSITPGQTVTIELGSPAVKTQTLTFDATGSQPYSFTGLTQGNYFINVTVTGTKGHAETTVFMKQCTDGENVNFKFNLTSGGIVIRESNTPTSGLEDIPDDKFPTDEPIDTSYKKLTLVLNTSAGAVPASAKANLTAKVLADGYSLDYTAFENVTLLVEYYDSGDVKLNPSGEIHDAGTVLEFYVPYTITDRKDFIVYREHNGNPVETLTAGTSRADGDGHFYVSNDGVYIYSQYFSDFAIASRTAVQPTPTYSSSSSKQTGSTIILQEGQVAPTAVPTVTPSGNQTVILPTVKPTTAPTTTTKSPAPFFGLIGGLGVAALVLRLRK